MGILHLIFRSSLTEHQSPNPQRSPATSAVWFNQFSQIWTESERNIDHAIHLQFLSGPRQLAGPV